MGTVPIGTGEFRTIHSRVAWMFSPVERSITVSAPQRVAHCIFCTSSSIDERTAELPMLALTFTRKLRPMIIGSLSGWLMLAGRIGSAAGDLGADELGLHVLASGNETHLRRDDALPRIVHLRDRAAAAEDARPPQLLGNQVLRGRVVQGRRLVAIAAAANPRLAQRRKSFADIVVLWPGGVIEIERFAGREIDFADRHADPFSDFDVNSFDCFSRCGGAGGLRQRPMPAWFAARRRRTDERTGLGLST